MFNRSREAIELLRYPDAFAVLALIAQRARWRTLLSPDDLAIGEAMLGDYENFGMSRSIYRNSLKKLVKWKQITIRTTNKGTIAKLISPLVFDINQTARDQLESQQEHHQRTNGKPSANHQETNGKPLTNKGRMEKGEQRKMVTKPLSIWEAKERIVALDKEIREIKSDYHNLDSTDGVTLPGTPLKPEAKARVAKLIQKRMETEPFLKGV